MSVEIPRQKLSFGDLLGYVLPGSIALCVVAYLLEEFPGVFPRPSEIMSFIKNLPFATGIIAILGSGTLWIILTCIIGRYSHILSKPLNYLYDCFYPIHSDVLFGRARDKMRKTISDVLDSSVYSIAAQDISSRQNTEIAARIQEMEGWWKLCRNISFYLLIAFVVLLVVQIWQQSINYIQWTVLCFILLVLNLGVFIHQRRATGGFVYQTYAPLQDD